MKNKLNGRKKEVFAEKDRKLHEAYKLLKIRGRGRNQLVNEAAVLFVLKMFLRMDIDSLSFNRNKPVHAEEEHT